MSYSDQFNEKAKQLEWVQKYSGPESGVIASGNQTEDIKRKIDEKKGRRPKENAAYDLIVNAQYMDNFIEWLEEEADRLRDEAKDEREAIVRNIERMGQNSDDIGVMERMQKDHAAGQPVDQKKLVEMLRKRGMDVDMDMPLAVLMHSYVPKAIEAANNENEHLEVDNDIHEQNADTKEQQADALDAQAATLRTQEAQLKAKYPDPNDENYQKGLEEIWQDVPREIVRVYADNYKEVDVVAANQEDIKMTQQFAGLNKTTPSLGNNSSDESPSLAAPPSLG